MDKLTLIGVDRLVEAVSKMYVCLTNGSCPPSHSQLGPVKKSSEVGFSKNNI
jgi:hypothetical protein